MIEEAEHGVPAVTRPLHARNVAVGLAMQGGPCDGGDGLATVGMALRRWGWSCGGGEGLAVVGRALRCGEGLAVVGRALRR